MLAVVKYLTRKITIVSSCCFNVSRRILCIKKKTNYSKVPNPPTTYLHRSAIMCMKRLSLTSLQEELNVWRKWFKVVLKVIFRMILKNSKRVPRSWGKGKIFIKKNGFKYTLSSFFQNTQKLQNKRQVSVFSSLMLYSIQIVCFQTAGAL